jgi:hypothetical protein
MPAHGVNRGARSRRRLRCRPIHRRRRCPEEAGQTLFITNLLG